MWDGVGVGTGVGADVDVGVGVLTTGPLCSPVDHCLQLQNFLSPSTGIFYPTADLSE